MDKKIYIIVALAVLAAILTYIRENRSPGSTFELPEISKKQLSSERAQSMADSTLVKIGIEKKNIRPIKNRNDVKVLYPQGFDALKFVKAINDSLSEFDATVVSIENTKEKSSIVQFKSNDVIIKSYIFSKEPPQDSKKGVSPLVKKQIKQR